METNKKRGVGAITLIAGIFANICAVLALVAFGLPSADIHEYFGNILASLGVQETDPMSYRMHVVYGFMGLCAFFCMVSLRNTERRKW